MVRETIGGWFVWTKTGRHPRYAHDTYEGAVAEAQRLARKHPGTKFIVLQMVDKFHEPKEPVLTEATQGDPLLEVADHA